ncbi:4'-phosphopantetheinyl transferase superfamily protein [Nonomuraea sp. NPDC050786]|uniref:4'-phosphopantetheinyl transferase family protein n=1 Tax=Nonomuraea sp. NPDC050786 TaxID=3154840 RepID=UPI0033CB951B
MIESILPPYVVSSDTTEDELEGSLFPEEEAMISKAVGKRRKEFTTARICARRAIRMLGRQPTPILSGQSGEPLWPRGLIGSVTHCTGYRGVVVATQVEAAAIGIDAEPNKELPMGVLQAIALPQEERMVRELGEQRPDVCWDRLLFCTKESVYKAWFPLARRWLGFHDALVDIRPGGTFEARLQVPGPLLNRHRLTGFSGRWLAGDGLILTAIVMPSSIYTPARQGLMAVAS